MRSSPPHNDLNVFVMDLWCMVPFYDAYLCEALRAEGIACTLGSISYHLEPEYFRQRGLRTDAGLCDVVSGLQIKNPVIRRTLKFIEFCGNITALAFRFLLAPPDVIHIQWLPLIEKGVSLELLPLKLARRRGTKLIYTVHNVLPHDSGTPLKDRFARIYRSMDALVCHTREAKDQLVRDFAIEKDQIWVVPHGPLFYDLPAISGREAKRRLGFAPEDYVVFCQGNVKPYKGIEFLLDAWSTVHRLQPHAKLVIAGTGKKDYLNTIRRRVTDLGIQSSVDLVFRYIPSEELPTYYQACDVAVYTHREITQSGALMTGIAFGKPIIATSLPGFGEALTHHENAHLVAYGDVAGLARLLAETISSDRKSQGAGEIPCEQKCRNSWRTIARHTRSCYEAMMGIANAGRPSAGENEYVERGAPAA